MLPPRSVSIAIALALALATALLGTAAIGAQSAASPYVPAGLVEVERGARGLDEIAAGFPAPDDAAALLAGWGWEGNAYFNFAGATANGTTSLEVSFHLFASESGATEAMSYYAAGRARMLGLSPLPIARVGDELLAIGGARDVGDEVTIYLRNGAYLIRISAVAPSGDPTADAVATARGITGPAGGPSPADPGTVDSLLPMLREMPAGSVVTDEGTRSEAEIAATFLRPGEAATFLADHDFRVNVYRYFAIPAGATGYAGSATSMEVSLHLFGSAEGAEAGLVYYAEGRAEAIGLRVVGSYELGDGAVLLQGPAPSGPGMEATVYLLLGNVLARISAVSPNGDPTADALAVTLLVTDRAVSA